MADKVTLTPVSANASYSSAIGAINDNLELIQEAIDDSLSRTELAPNTMGGDLDMNSNRIINLPTPASSAEPVTKAYGDANYGAVAAAAAAASASAASTSATNAATSASAASTSATSASTSASTASTAATSAATSATNASTSATSAAASATSATTASTQALAAVGFSFQYSTSTTMADPGTGIIRFNNATISSATAIAVSDLAFNTGNPSVAAWITSFDDSTSANKGLLRLRKLDNAAVYVDFQVAALTDNVGWSQIAVNAITVTGPFSNGDTMVMSFFRTGDAGTGSGDVVGPASSTDSNIAEFNGATGKLLKDGGVAISAYIKTFLNDVDAATARSTLGLGSSDTVTFTSIELGHPSDTTITRASAGNIAVEGVTLPLNSTTSTHTAGAIELGHASDTTITRLSAGNIAVEGVGIPLNTTTSTHTAGAIELGHASDTTLARASAGVLSVEGNHVPSPASQARGDVLYHNGTTWARLPAGTSGRFLKTKGAGADPAWEAHSQIITYNSNGGITTGGETIFCAGQTNATESVVNIPIPVSGTISNLNVATAGSPAAPGETFQFWLSKNYATTASTCTITFGNNTAADNTNTVSVTAGDLICVKVVSSAASGASGFVKWSVLLTF